MGKFLFGLNNYGLLNICHMGRDSGYFFVTNTNYDRVFGHQQGEFVGSLFCNYVLHLIDQIPFVLLGQIWVIGSNRCPLLPVAGRAEFIDISLSPSWAEADKPAIKKVSNVNKHSWAVFFMIHLLR